MFLPDAMIAGIGIYNRILFNAFEQVSIVSIEEVKKRDEHTY